MKTLLLGFALMGTVPGCSDPTTMNTVRATSREIRGKLPLMIRGVAVSRVIAVDAKTRRVVAQTTLRPDGTFVLTGVTVGATYRLHAIAGRKSIPIVFPKSTAMPMAKANMFKVGTKTSPRTGMTEGPIDVGDLSMAMEDTMDQLTTDQSHAPNMQEDFDEDGMPDGADNDVDGDNIPNAMDMDNDGDGMPDNTEFNDQDGDGLTNDSDPDMDGDGMPNSMDMDNDNDGMPDAMDMTPEGAPSGNPNDNDGDGLPNSEDETPNGEDPAPPAMS